MSSENKQIVNNLSRLQRLGVYSLVLIIKVLLSTLRIRYDKNTEDAVSKDKAGSFLIWHNRLLFTAQLKLKFRKKIPMYGLVSPSKDGAYLSYVFECFKINTVRGSSNKRGASALIEMLHLLKNGKCVTITPDGPRGPKYEFKGASLSVAKKTDSMVVFMRAYPERFIKLKSWDDFIIPFPFSKLHFQAIKFDNYKDFESEANSLGLSENDYAQILLGRNDLHDDSEKIQTIRNK